MNRSVVAAIVLSLCAPCSLGADELVLNAVQYPERHGVDVLFTPTSRAPRAELQGDVKFKEGTARIDLSWKRMKPAVLFGGDVTSYVLWAITRDGLPENMGELWVRDESSSAAYATGQKSFALVVTAESHPLVERPSSLVVFTSRPVEDKTARNSSFTFAAFAPAPAHEHESLADVLDAGKQPLDFLQARKAYELAERAGAAEEAASTMREARITLAQATNLAGPSGGDRKALVDYSRRTVALASEAIRETTKKREARELEERIAKRRAEMASLEERAATAEAARQKTEEARATLETSLGAARGEMARIAAERQNLEKDMEGLRQKKAELEESNKALLEQKSVLMAAREGLEKQKAILEGQNADLGKQKADLERRNADLAAQKTELESLSQKLAVEKEGLSKRLEGALSLVADTKKSARGLIVSLPDILFDVNEATLKPEAKVTLAKMGGILLLMPEQNLRVEGHTDATGKEEYNLKLSEKRAASVAEFLKAQGIAEKRIVSKGYGMAHPVAKNETKEGRAKNRRVEVVIAEGTVQEAGN